MYKNVLTIGAFKIISENWLKYIKNPLLKLYNYSETKVMVLGVMHLTEVIKTNKV